MACPVRSHLVFVYGTLKTGQPNHKYMTDLSNGEATLFGKARTDHRWPLVIATELNVPFLLRWKGTGQNVIGEIYSVDEKKFAFLDIFERCPEFYARHEILLTLLDKPSEKVSAWTYFLEQFKTEMINLEHYEEYDSNGDHGRVYIEQATRKNAVQDCSISDQIKLNSHQ